jgi:hypothetical protein
MLKILLPLFWLAVFACSPKADNKNASQEPPIPELPTQRPPEVPPGKPGFLRFDQIEKIATDDALILNDDDQANARYMLGCNFYNQGADMEDFLGAVNKGINMISTERLIAAATPIDDTGCVTRIDIDEIGMTREEWQRFERANILPFISDSIRGRTLRALTQTNQPLVYASSFFTTVMQADQTSINNQLYYDLTEQPLNDPEFFAKIGINIQNEFNREEPACAGGGRSQIALGKPRLICLFESNDGYLLITYDVSLANNDSIFENPFLPEMGKIPGLFTDKIFGFVASEMIFSMPNGLMTGYRLSNAGGSAEVIAPTNVVIDIEQAQKGLPPDITLGACSNCHHQEAAIFFKDGVFDHVRLNGNFQENEKLLADTFYRADRFQARRNVANQTHTRALQQIGVSTLKADPVVTNLIQPLRGELSIEDIAGYLFLEPQDFKERLGGTNLSKVLFGNLLSDGGVVPLADFVKGYPILIQELILFRDVGQL